MKKFDIPEFYRSTFISKIKSSRKMNDPRKKDFTPAVLDFGPVRFMIARHFGFCYGVESAIEISYRTIEENPGRKIYLLSEMIHNPGVNNDLLSRGVKFLMDTAGNMLEDWDVLTADDIVIIPAFGITISTELKLKEKGINPYRYNTTCPFVEKVWNRSGELGKNKFTIVIHGKHYHEETRATFSHSSQTSPSLIIRDIKEAEVLSSFILDDSKEKEFYDFFKDKYSVGFNLHEDLKRIGVVNQTTMLASETQAIADLLRDALLIKYGEEELKDHFADTKDTLCYATNDNQDSTYGLLKEDADMAIVVGGYNSSNTTHIVELLAGKFKTYFISSADKLLSPDSITYYDIHSGKEVTSGQFIPKGKTGRIILTSGASCPDAVVDSVLQRILSFYPGAKSMGEVLKEFV